MSFKAAEILVSVMMYGFIVIAAIAIIFAVIEEVRSGHADYVIFSFLFLSGVFLFVFASEGAGDFLEVLLSGAGIYISEEATEKLGRVVVLLWIMAAFLFYRFVKKKKDP